MERTVYILRSSYGTCIKASFEPIGNSVPYLVGTTRELVALLMHEDTSARLFNACWKKAIAEWSIAHSERITEAMGDEHLADCKVDADQLEAIASEMVNNEKSSFYVHGR
jgi:hypothetical protein